MAKSTNIALRSQIVYQVFPRQYSNAHNLKGVTKDLSRIKNLGVDYIQLLPIHPIGIVARKGSIGSPYSIMDYRAIDPNYGTMEDFKDLLEKSHNLGLKVIMDIVFNHTSKDSVLAKTHPEWFYHKENGDFANRVGEWSDITDLKYEYKELTEYLTDTLLMYIRMGVDGFRFDVASIIPYDFFAYAFPILRQEKEDILLIAESVHIGFTKYIRDLGYEASSDAELYSLFDVLYEYDTYDYLYKYMKNECSIGEYLIRVEAQEALFPKNYVKLRYLENHDFGCANQFLNDDIRLRNLLAISYFCKGMSFLFNGIETLSRHLPNLFEIDPIDWNKTNPQMVEFIKTLNYLKKDKVFQNGIWEYTMITESVILLSLKNKDTELYLIANLEHTSGMIRLPLTGKYENAVTKESITIDEYINLCDEPIILKKISQ